MCIRDSYELCGFVTKDLDEILKIPREAEKGVFVLCDIELPAELHDKFKDYPLCPVSRCVEFDELSEYQQNLTKQNNTKYNDKSKKLILDFNKKENYLCHYRYLQGIVKLGYKVTKIHKCIEFKQSQWLKKYIDMNTTFRQQKGISDFLKDFHKLMNNAIYGKTNENVLGRANMELLTDYKKAIKKMSKENFKNGSNKDGLFFIESHRAKVKYDRPSYIGNAILDLSKLYMFEFHYNYMKPKYGDKCQLVYTDTDSFVYHVKTEDLYQDQFNDRNEYFDLSEVSIAKFKDSKNAKVIGKMKDETKFIPIVEFCSLASKSYSFITDYDIETTNENKNDKTHLDNLKKSHYKIGKGVSRSVLKHEITHADYKKTLNNGYNISKKNISLRSYKHQLFTYQATKICLNALDTKMYRDTFNIGHPFGYIKS
jgi:hypothetical protein